MYLNSLKESFPSIYNSIDGTVKIFSYKQDKPIKELIEKFLKRTKNVKDMSIYSELLSSAIKSIKGHEEKEALQTIFDFGVLTMNLPMKVKMTLN